jgi:ferrous-iron efflux pump FieF
MLCPMNKQDSTPPVFQPDFALKAGYASMATVSVLIVMKAVAFVLSGSVSVLASLLDSIMDGIVSLMNFFAIRESLKPADKNHRYGHGKIEGLAALMQAAFIGGSAMFLALESFRRLAHPQEIGAYGVGIVVMAISIVLSLLLVAYQKHAMKRAPSLAVEADKMHYAYDSYINGGVMLALILQMFGAPVWIDSLFALIVAFWMVRSVIDIGKSGIDMLLDRELPKETREKIKTLVLSDQRVRGLHDLRTRMVGMNINVSFDIELDPQLTLCAAHAIGVDVEKILLQSFPNAEIMIHIDPLGEPEDHRHSVAGVHV